MSGLGLEGVRVAEADGHLTGPGRASSPVRRN